MTDITERISKIIKLSSDKEKTTEHIYKLLVDLDTAFEPDLKIKYMEQFSFCETHCGKVPRGML